MSISDTNKARQYASIAEVAAAQSKIYADKLDSAPDYASQAAASAADAAKAATTAVAAESVVNNYVIAASDFASQSAQSAITAGSAAEAAIGQTLRVPAGEEIESLPLSGDRENTVLSFDSSGDTALISINTIARLDQDGKVPVANMPAIALNEPFVVNSQAEMLALSNAVIGDVAKRTDKGLSFILGSLPPSLLSNWIQLNDDILSQLALSSGAAQIGALDDSSNTTTVQGALSLKPSTSYLSSAAGSSSIGYSGGATPSNYDAGSTVQSALNRMAARVVYAVKYGVKADGVTDDTEALQALSVAVSAMTNPVVQVIFPQGTSIVGSQQQAPNATSGYSFRPSYEATGGFGWFYVNERSGKTIIDAYGYKIKLKSELKHGSFNPTTGASYPSTAPFYDNNYQATVGHCATFRLNADITVLGLECDGSASSLLWGGPFGDIGWQCVSFGIYAAGNVTQSYIDVNCHDAGTDAWYFSTNSGWTPPISGKRDVASMVRCIGSNSRRQGLTIAGGGNIKIDQCQFYSIGRYAQGAGSYYSSPEACLDIESESGTVYDFVANDCQFIDGRSTILAASFINPASRAHFTNCLMRTNSDTAQITTTMSDVFFDNCVIQGSGIDCRDASSQWKTSFRSCSFSNFIGSDVAQLSTYVGTYGLVEDCVWDLIIDAKVTNNLPFAMLGGDLSSTPAYPQKGSFRFNRINLKGNQNLATPGSNGRIALGYVQFFYDMDFRVTGSGLTGTTLLQFDTGASFVNQRGITCDSPKIVDSNLGTSIAMPTGGYMLPRTMSVAALAIAPQVDNIMTIGTPSNGCANIYVGAGSGVVTKSPNGTAWKIVVSDSGVLSTTTP